MKNLYYLITLLTYQLAAQPNFDKLLEANSFPISHDFTGAGWNHLIHKGIEADYFLVGEEHGIREIPVITKELFKSLHSEGYKYFAIETGPISAELITNLLEKDEKAVDEFFTRYPFSIPFYSWKEELELLRTVGKLSKTDRTFWGLDQEFILAARPLFDRYKNSFSDPSYLEGEVSKAHAGYRKIVEQRQQDGIWLVNQNEESWAHLRNLAATPEAMQLIEELKKSSDIYNLFFSGKSHENNEARVDNFISLFENYQSESDDGKVMIKMGSTHTMKGESFFGVHDLGDYLAGQSHKKTFHLAMVPISGFQNKYVPFLDKKTLKTPIDHAISGSLIDFAAGVISQENVVLLDTSPFHEYLDDLPEDKNLRKFILGYDAILFIPNATPSTFLGVQVK